MVLGAIAAVLAVQLIGAIWYSPIFLGKIWMDSTFPNRNREMLAKEMGSAYAVTLVSSACLAFVLEVILTHFFKVKTIVEAVKLALGLASLTTLIDTPHLAFSQRNLVAYVIDHLFDTISLVAMSACIFYMSNHA